MRHFGLPALVLPALLAALACSTSSAITPAPPPAACTLTPAFVRADAGGAEQVQVYEAEPDAALGGARPLIFVVGSVHLNTDGTRISYHRDDPRGRTRAINDMRNAMRSGRTIAEFEAVAANNWQPLEETWRVLSSSVIERDSATGAPCVDSEGYLVSKTADVSSEGAWARDGDCDQAKWIDSMVVPTIVLPMRSEFQTKGALTRTPSVMMSLGEQDRVVMGIVGDTGPVNELGEASIAMNRALLGLPANAIPANRRDANARFEGPRAVTILFPGAMNRLGYPVSAERVAAEVGQRFEAWGGQARLAACVAQLP